MPQKTDYRSHDCLLPVFDEIKMVATDRKILKWVSAKARVKGLAHAKEKVRLTKATDFTQATRLQADQNSQ